MKDKYKDIGFKLVGISRDGGSTDYMKQVSSSIFFEIYDESDNTYLFKNKITIYCHHNNGRTILYEGVSLTNEEIDTMITNYLMYDK